MATALCTAAQVKTAAGISGATHDTQLAELIGQVSAQMEAHMGRVIGATTYTAEKHSGSGFTVVLVLHNGPLTSGTGVSAITVDGTALDSADWDAPASTRPGEGRVVYYTPSGEEAYWPKGVRNVSVTYEAGWATVPEDLELAAIDEVRSRFSITQPGGGPERLDLVSQGSDQKGTSTYERDPSGFLVKTLAAMRPYRRGESWR